MKRVIAAIAAALLTGCASTPSRERFEYVAYTMAEAFDRKNYDTFKSLCHPSLLEKEEPTVRAYFDKMVERLGSGRAEWEITKLAEREHTASMDVTFRTSSVETGTRVHFEKHDGRWFVISVP
jgi:hypothetical protein